MQGERINVKEHLKFPGQTLDSLLNFETHFNRLAISVDGVTALLGRLLQNIGGPDEKVCFFYTGVIKSMTLCRSPI